MSPRPFAYFDTSVVAKRYFHEPGSQQAFQLLRRHRFLSSAVVLVELQSLIQRSRRDGLLTSKSSVAILKKVETDRTKWELVAVSAALLAKAEDIVRNHDARALDAIHLAAVLTVNSQLGGKLPFVTADSRQSTVAKQLNLNLVWIG